MADGTHFEVFDCSDALRVSSSDFIINPESFIIAPAYPNPFNAQTRIAYDLPKSANVKLSIFDINGRTVDILDQGLKTLGQHRLIWDGSGFISGTYFVRLNAGGVYYSQKMVLVK